MHKWPQSTMTAFFSRSMQMEQHFSSATARSEGFRPNPTSSSESDPSGDADGNAIAAVEVLGLVKSINATSSTGYSEDEVVGCC